MKNQMLISVILSLSLLLVNCTLAEVVLEATYDVNQNLDIGSPSAGTLLSDANVFGGRLNVSGDGTSGVKYGYTVNYLDIAEGSSWGENTIVAIINLDSAPYPYDMFFGSGNGYNIDYRDGIRFYAHLPSGPGPALSLHNDDGGPINIATVAADLGAQYQLDTGKDYFIAGSWRDEGSTIAMRLYVREVDDVNGTTAVYVSTDQNDPGGPTGFVRADTYDQELYVGRSLTGDTIDGTVDMVRCYNVFADEETEFEDIFSNCVFNPSDNRTFYEDFEAPNGSLPDGWSFRTADAIGSADTVTDESVSGQRSCLIERSFGTGMVQLSRDGITVNANTEYEVKCYIKSEYESGGYALLMIEGLDTPISAPELCISQNWTPFTFRFTTDDTNLIYLSYLLYRGDMKVWLDDFQMYETNDLTAESMMPGGDFEYFNQNIVPGWTIEDMNEVSLRLNDIISYEGPTCAQVIFQSPNSVFAMSQRIFDFMPGDDYDFSIYALRGAGSTGQLTRTVEFYDPFNSIISFIDQNSTLSDSWSKQSLTFTVPQNCSEVIIRLTATGTSGSICFDAAELIDTMTTSVETLEGTPEWQGLWISYDEPNGTGTRYFKKTFSLNETPTQSKCIVNASGDFELKINGQVVGNGTVSNDSEIFNINDYLDTENTILVEVEDSNEQPKLILEAGIVVPSGNDLFIKTDDTWQASRQSDSNWSEPELLGKWDRVEGGELISYQWPGRMNSLQINSVDFPEVIAQAESVNFYADISSIEALENDRQLDFKIIKDGVIYYEDIINDANTSNWTADSNHSVSVAVSMDKIYPIIPLGEGTLLSDANVFGGRLNVSGDGTSGVKYGYTVNYLDIAEGSSWGENTIVAIINLDSAPYPYDMFFGSGNGYNIDYRDGIRFYAHLPSGPGPALSLHNDDGGPINIATVAADLGAQYQLDTGKDYFIAGSWRDEGSTIAMRLYVREVDDVNGTTAVYVSTDQNDPGGPTGFVRADTYDQELYVGRSLTGDTIDGTVDMVRCYNVFADEETEFESLFNNIDSNNLNNISLEADYNDSEHLTIGSPYRILIDIPRAEFTDSNENEIYQFRVHKSTPTATELPVTELTIYGGNPTFSVDGQVQSPLYGALSYPLYSSENAKSIRDFADSGYDFFRYPVFVSTFWAGLNQYDFSSIDAAFIGAIAQNRDIKILLNFYFRGKGQPSWWCEAYPDELATYWPDRTEDYTGTTNPCVASELYKQDVITMMEDTIDHLKAAGFAEHILGFTINGEPFWSKGPEITNATFGYGGTNQRALNDWLTDRYSSGELSDIWAGYIDGDDPNGIYQLPEPNDRLESQLGIFRDPADGRRLIIFNEYLSWIKYKSFDDIASGVKSYVDGDSLCSRYEGYSLVKGYDYTVGYIDGFSSVHEIVESNSIDFTHSPIHYYYRKMGDSSAFMGTVDSVSLKNELYFVENDIRTFIGNQDSYWMSNAKSTVEVMKRDFSMIFSHNVGMYWYDMYGGWYDNEGLQQVVAQCKDIYDDNLSRQRSRISEVAVFIDESSPYYFGYDANGSNAYSMMVSQMAGALFRIGAPADIYELDSLSEPDFPDYKCYIFLGTVHIDQAMRSAIQNKIYNGTGKTVLWTYGSGLCDDTSLNVSNMNSVTGLQFQQINERSSLLMEIASSDSNTISGFSESDIIGSTEEGEPLFASSDTNSVEVLGNYENTSYAGFFEDTVNSTNVIYYGSGLVPPKLLRNVAVQAGCHMYVDSMDPIYVNNIFFGIHRSGPSGNVTITLPQASKVRDAFSGEWIVSQPQSSFTVYMYSGDTAAFILTTFGAKNPSPANEAIGISINANLIWVPGEDANTHRVYFDTNETDVANANTSSPEYKGTFDVNEYEPGILSASTTYYWRIDEIGNDGVATGDVWSFTTADAPGQATSPSPSNSATGVSTTADLSWTAGSGTNSHNVYFGTDSTPDETEYKGNQAGTTYDPGTLAYGTTYYWRIDEVGPGGTTTGTVWSFTTTPPTFVAAGAVTSNTTAITPALPAGIATGDILLLFLETSNQAISISNQNGGTWTQVTNSPQGTGTAAGTTGARLTAFWSRYNGTQGAPTTSDSGDHQLGRMIAIRGAVASGNPWDVTAGGVEAVSDTSGSIPGATTTVTNTLVVTAIATSLPDLSSTTRFSAWTNANLTSVTERTDNSVTAGNGGGLGVATGVRAATGAYGNTAVTLATSAYKGMMSIAIKP